MMAVLVDAMNGGSFIALLLASATISPFFDLLILEVFAYLTFFINLFYVDSFPM